MEYILRQAQNDKKTVSWTSSKKYFYSKIINIKGERFLIAPSGPSAFISSNIIKELTFLFEK